MSPIPDWNLSGIIPPIRPGVMGHDPDRSPYKVELIEVVQKFTLSQERANILTGLMSYRAAWHRAGVTSGFQWLDGSFLENIEETENRAPRDMDVVTFFHIPAGHNQSSLFPHIRSLLDTKAAKIEFSVDAYGIPLDGAYEERKIANTTYWYSMWSHRRSGLWKGFLQVNLDPATDAACSSLIQQKVAGGFA